MRPNTINEMWRDRKWVTLGRLSVPNGLAAEVMARQGFDALCVDLQRGLRELTSDIAGMTAGGHRQRDGLRAATA